MDGMRNKLVSWLIVGLAVFLIAYRPDTAANIAGGIGSFLGKLGNGVGTLLDRLAG